METPFHLNYDHNLSLKVVLFSTKNNSENEETFKFLSPPQIMTQSKNVESFPMKKFFKFGTSENINFKPKHLEDVTSKQNIYLFDDIVLHKPISFVQSSENLQLPWEETIKSDSSLKSMNKIDILMTESQRRRSNFNASTFEVNFPNEIDTREVLTEENALRQLKKLFFQNYLFWNVDEQTIKNLLPYIFLKKFRSNNIALSQGEVASNFFIIQSGIIIKKSMKNGVSVNKYLEKGKMFGEKSLFDHMKRTSSYISEGNCLLWGINVATFFKLLTSGNHQNYNENRIFLNKLSVFKVVNSKAKDQICLNLSEQKFNKAEVLLNQGSACACCFIVKKGELSLRNKKNKIERIYKPGDYVGDWSLNSFIIPSSLETSDKEETTLLVISNKRLRNILGDNLYSLNWKNLCRLAFSQSMIFSHFPSETLEKIINNLEISCFEKNQVLVKYGTSFDSLYIALEGNLMKNSTELEVVNNEIVSGECALFGESYLLHKTSLKKGESIIMDENGTVGQISKTNIERILGMKLEDVLLADPRTVQFQKPSLTNISNIEKPNQEDIEVIELAGEGQFGLVFLIKLNKQILALKICAKAYIIARRFELYLINEKLIQSSLGDFPFLIKFHQSFQDQNLVYFLMDYVHGKDLATIFYNGAETYTPEVARFYIAQLVLTVEYLHKKKILHRDIKLNNILVDEFGYIKLIDFGIAKLLNMNRTFTIVGTPHYMAPEIILGKGYEYSVDYWAIGVCLYEMLLGKLPFGDDSDDPLDVYGCIVSSKLPTVDKSKLRAFPDGTIDILNKFLNKDGDKRFGKNNIKEIKEHLWFCSYNWDALLEKKVKTFHGQKVNDLENVKGKKLTEYLNNKEIQNYFMKEEKKLSTIQNWDEIF